MSEYYAKLTALRTQRAVFDLLSVNAVESRELPYPISGDHLTRARNSKDHS